MSLTMKVMSVWTVDGAHGQQYMIFLFVTLIVVLKSPGLVTILLLLLVVLTASLMVMVVPLG